LPPRRVPVRLGAGKKKAGVAAMWGWLAIDRREGEGRAARAGGPSCCCWATRARAGGRPGAAGSAGPNPGRGGTWVPGRERWRGLPAGSGPKGEKEGFGAFGPK